MRSCWIKAVSCLMAALIVLAPMSTLSFAGSAETPDILVGYQMGTPTMVAGTTVNLSIPITNRTSVEIESIIASMDDPSKYPFEIQSMSSAASAIYLGPTDSKLMVLPLKILKTAEPKTYGITLNFDYKTSDGSKGTITKTIYIKITNNLNLPKLEIRNTDIEGGYIGAGEKATVFFDVLNSGDVPLKDIKVAFKDLGTGLLPANGDRTATISQLAEKRTQRITFELKAEDKAETKSYVQTLELSYKDEYDKSYTLEKKVYIPVRKSTDQVLDLSLANIKVPGGAKAGSDFTVSFDLANHSQFVLQNVTAKLEADPGMLSKSAPVQQAKKIEAGKSYPFSFKLFSKSDLEAKSYPVKAVISYEIGTGNEQKTYYEYLNVDITGGSGKTTPRVMVSNYSYGSGPVLANQEFPLKLSFSNTNQSKPIYNAKITLVSAENIFTPVNASNSFFISTIGAGGTLTRDISLMADYAAKPKNYPVEVKIEYEDADGKAFTQSDTISIPVMQELVPRLSKIEIPTISNINTPTQMSLTVFNIGKAEIRNIFVTITGDNITSDQGEVYLGNIGEGSDTYFDGNFTPTALGEQKGTVHIKYQDGSGKEFEITHEFTTTVEEMPPMEPGMDGMPPEENPGDKWVKWIKIGAGLLLGVGVIFFGIRFYKRRKSLKQADKL